MTAPEYLDLRAIFHTVELHLSLLLLVNSRMHLPSRFFRVRSLVGLNGLQNSIGRKVWNACPLRQHQFGVEAWRRLKTGSKKWHSFPRDTRIIFVVTGDFATVFGQLVDLFPRQLCSYNPLMACIKALSLLLHRAFKYFQCTRHFYFPT